MKKIELNFSIKKDKKVMQWLELLKNMDMDSSPYVVLALEYYISTGNYLSLGSVDRTMEPSDKLRKTFYIPNNSVVEEWSEELIKRKKGLLSTQIRYILDNCIETGEKGEVKPYAELVMMAEKDVFKSPNLQTPLPQVVATPPPVVKPTVEITSNTSYYEETDEIDDEEIDARQQVIETMYNALLPDVDDE